jgi:DNA mismatch repair ATPase MutS
MDRGFAADLSAQTLFNIMKSAARFKPTAVNPLEYLTAQPEVILHRLDLIDELIQNEALYRMLAKLLPELEDMKDLFTRENAVNEDAEQSMYTVSEIEFFTNSIDKLYAFFSSGEGTVRSVGMKSLSGKIIGIAESDSYQQLKAASSKVGQTIRNVKSITVGVNLNSQLMPIDASVVSINTEVFKTGNLIDKLFRGNGKDDPYYCLSPLEMVGKGISQDDAMTFKRAVNSTLNKHFKDSVKSWKPAIRLFTKSESRFLVQLADDIRFLLGGATLVKKLMELGVPVCKPQVVDKTERAMDVKQLYNPAYVLGAEPAQAGQSVASLVFNDFRFDEQGIIYIFTGPNQGGKSMFTKAVGLAQMMFQLGLFVPAKQAAISPVDQLLTHFPLSTQNQDHSRFEEECQRLMEQIRKLTRHSMLLMDETFSSTSAAEATHIAEQVLKGLRGVGCRIIFATHLHELAGKIDELNAQDEQGSRIDSLIAELRENADGSGTRSYAVSRSRPQSNSFARDIAEKYGLTYEGLLACFPKEAYARAGTAE